MNTTKEIFRTTVEVLQEEWEEAYNATRQIWDWIQTTPNNDSILEYSVPMWQFNIMKKNATKNAHQSHLEKYKWVKGIAIKVGEGCKNMVFTAYKNLKEYYKDRMRTIRAVNNGWEERTWRVVDGPMRARAMWMSVRSQIVTHWALDKVEDIKWTVYIIKQWFLSWFVYLEEDSVQRPQL